MEKFIFCVVGGLSEVLQSGINKNGPEFFSFLETEDKIDYRLQILFCLTFRFYTSFTNVL